MGTFPWCSSMNIRDLTVLTYWIKGGATLQEVERAEQYGMYGGVRFTSQAVRAYKLLWLWAAYHMADPWLSRQAKYASKCGYPALNRRIVRALRWIDKIRNGEVVASPPKSGGESA